MPDINELKVFNLVVETGSFTKTAERLGISRSVVSRRISMLEEKLGVRLLNRSTHYVVPTTLGHSFHARIRRVLADLNEAVSSVTGAASEVSGVVRISSPTLFGTKYLTSAVADILQSHPRLEIVLDFNDQPGELFGEGTDFAIRIGIMKDSAMIAKYFKPVKQVLVAAPSYLEASGQPAHPRELLRHTCLLYANPFCPPPWRFRTEGHWQSHRPNARLVSNNPEAIRDATISGMGLSVLPNFVVSEDLVTGSLVPVLQSYPLEEMGLYALFPPNAMLPARVRSIVDILAAKWKKPLPAGAPLAPSTRTNSFSHLL